MNRNLLSPLVGIAMLKSEFCFCTGISPYKLKCIISKNEKELQRMGYSKYDKILMPSVVLFLLDVTKLRIDVDLYAQVRNRFGMR